MTRWDFLGRCCEMVSQPPNGVVSAELIPNCYNPYYGALEGTLNFGRSPDVIKTSLKKHAVS